MCRSQAWDAKVVTSAWWVHPEQVRGGQPEVALTVKCDGQPCVLCGQVLWC